MNDTHDSELDKILSNLLEDHVDMYGQDRDSSAALGADLEVAKAALTRWRDKAVVKARINELEKAWGHYAPGDLGNSYCANRIDQLKEHTDDK